MVTNATTADQLRNGSTTILDVLMSNAEKLSHDDLKLCVCGFLIDKASDGDNAFLRQCIPDSKLRAKIGDMLTHFTGQFVAALSESEAAK